MERGQRKRTVTIANGGTNSTAFETAKCAQGTFQLPAAITGTDFTIEFSNDGVTYTQVPTDGVEPNPIIGASADETHKIPKATFAARYGRIVAATAQGAARSITILTSA